MDPLKCDKCLGYGNTHERSCPNFSRTVMDPCPSCAAHVARCRELEEKLERTERLWSEDRAAVRDWAAASDAIGELYEILGITKDSAGFQDGFTKIVEAVKARNCQKKALQQINAKAESHLALYEKVAETARKLTRVSVPYEQGRTIVDAEYFEDLRAALDALKEGKNDG